MRNDVKMMLAAAMVIAPEAAAVFDEPKYVRSIPTMKDIKDSEIAVDKAIAKRRRKNAKRLENQNGK
ncbi:hypothetical protein [Methylotenera sp.]|uniref:hypothetical protein n=1 Tax=Methylotenera sp. TaxID=2051956 RepID=UPI00248717AA|nr:hypothetical protein [Methylotenera sp.]MDI1362561.1 hypothetical protein [Methylotenera sp.]